MAGRSARHGPGKRPEKGPGLVRLMFGDGTQQKAVLTALAVGTILTAINHGDTIVAGHWPPLLKVVLTYLTPYCVTIWGAVTGKRALLKVMMQDGGQNTRRET